MKSTTTVTTSSYYGNVDNRNQQQRQYDKQSQQQSHNITNFIPPNEMLKRLIPYSNVQKQKQAQLRAVLTKQQQSLTLSSQNNNLNKAQLVNQIQLLQGQLNNIHAEIIQSQNLLNVRDSLYGQLDLLREQRQLIQGDITYLQAYTTSKQVNINNIKPNNQGYKEMNQRLRRRMSQIREYIHKMQLENNKIQQSLNYNTVLNVERSYYRSLSQQQVNNNMNNAWVDNGYYYGQREKIIGRVDELITKLHIKQQQALQNVRRQQEEINRRNTFNRASFMPNNTAGGFHQARTYYPQGETISRGRFYSPEYRY